MQYPDRAAAMKSTPCGGRATVDPADQPRRVDATNFWYYACGTVSKNTSFSLGEHFAKFVGEQVEQGRYGSASDVVRAGLRLLEEQEAHLAALRAALVAGENSGPPKPFDFDKFIARKRKEQAAASKPARR
jgi:antitoxin ParD1/3/4